MEKNKQPQAAPLTEKQMRRLVERGHDPAELAAARPLPAAEADAERRIRELVDAALPVSLETPQRVIDSLHKALRTYGEECRAAEREACVKAGKALAVSDETPERKGWNAALAVYAAAIRSRHD